MKTLPPSDWSRSEIELAWESFEPTAESPFDRPQARHLLRRAGFGGSADEIAKLADAGLQGAVTQLLAPASAEAFQTDADTLIRTSLVLGDTDHLVDWWIYRMRTDPFAAREKVTWFWHGHFCTSRVKVPDARLLLKQNQILRDGGLGSFPDLVKAISRDSAMLIYLDSTENSKSHPNENYARELMELFCLGLGNYTEDDIKELARCFTGWEVRRGRFRFSASNHDTGIKEILGNRGTFDGDESIELVLQQPAAPRFIASRLIRFYVTEDEVPAEVVNRLAEILIENKWQLAPTLARIWQSNVFYSERSIGRCYVSPVQWTMQWLRTLEMTTDLNGLRRDLEAMGCVPLEPPNVKGWPGGVTWVDPARLAARISWARRLSNELNSRPGGIEPWMQLRGMTSAQSVVEWTMTELVGRPIASQRQQVLLEMVKREREPSAMLRTAIQVASALPETHVS